MSKIALRLVEKMHLSWDYGRVFHTDGTLIALKVFMHGKQVKNQKFRNCYCLTKIGGYGHLYEKIKHRKRMMVRWWISWKGYGKFCTPITI